MRKVISAVSQKTICFMHACVVDIISDVDLLNRLVNTDFTGVHWDPCETIVVIVVTVAGESLIHCFVETFRSYSSLRGI